MINIIINDTPHPYAVLFKSLGDYTDWKNTPMFDNNGDRTGVMITADIRKDAVGQIYRIDDIITRPYSPTTGLKRPYGVRILDTPTSYHMIDRNVTAVYYTVWAIPRRFFNVL